MAKLAIGPTGREALRIDIGTGNGNQRAGNAPGNNAPAGAQRQTHANDADETNLNGRARNDETHSTRGDERVGGRGDDGDHDNARIHGRDHGEDGDQNEKTRGKGRGDDGDDNGRTRGKDHGDDGDHQDDGLWAGFRNRGEHGGKGRDYGRDVHWTVFLPTLHEHSTSETDDPVINRQREEDRERRWQESYSANQASLRRGLIRDFLRQNLENTILDTHENTRSPIDLQRLTHTVAEQLSKTFDDPAALNTRNLNLITSEISHLLDREFNLHTGNQTVIPYDRGIQIATQLLRYVSSEADTAAFRMTDRQMLDALVLLQVCSNPGKYIKEMREITAHKPSILPDEIPWSAFRDTGMLAANLIREGAAVKNTAQIEAAVQKFFKLLLANNELGVLLAAVRLCADARVGMVPYGSIVTLVRIYELIAQLMIVTERAMKEAAETAARKPPELTKMDRTLAFTGALESTEAETALRQYLAFNPAAQSDSVASAFFSEHLADDCARIAVDSSQRQIVEWLSSGRHRFVTEVDLGQSIGIVIDRATDACFTASQIRVVLVRDGSVLGWHILRSSLVA